MRILIKNGTVVCPYENIHQQLDILIENGMIIEIAPAIALEAERVIDATGCYVFPGLIDMHVHLREPGLEYKEDITTGSMAAAAGGFTTVCCMPNTKPVADHAAIIRYIKDRAEEAGLCEVLPIAAITKGLQGKELSEMGELLEAGAVAFSDDGKPVESSRMMRLAMSYASAFDALLISHCEDRELAQEGVMNEGLQSAVLGLKGIPQTAESLMVAREILLAQTLNTKIHIAHVSCRQSVDLLRMAKKNGVKVSAETCGHYLYATDALIKDYDTNTKVNPPLRTQEDVDAVRAALCDGTIDCIVSDHAPHHEDEKRLEYNLAAFGISGLETSFALCYTAMVKSGLMTVDELIKCMTVRPSEILGLNKRGICKGAQADLTIADCSAPYHIDVNSFKSKGKNNPFHGDEVYGKIKHTVYKGSLVFSEGELIHG